MKDPEAINDNLLKLTGKAALPELPKIGYNYEVRAKGSITSIIETDREDGGRVFTAIFRPILIELITEEGKTIKARDIRSDSQKLRARIWKIWNEKNISIDFNNYYHKIMISLIYHIEEYAERN